MNSPDDRKGHYPSGAYLDAAFISGVAGALAAGIFALSIDMNAGGLVVLGPIPWIISWLILLRHMRGASTRKTVLFGVISGLCGSLFPFCGSLGLSRAFFISIPVGIITAFLIRNMLRGYQWLLPPPPDPTCPRCEYNLTGNESGTCPECGLVIPEHIRKWVANNLPKPRRKKGR